MIRSMTGFGDASEQVDGVHYAVEVRSVNSRYFKTTVRLAEELSGIEPELEIMLRKRLNRGSITLAVKIHEPLATAVPRISDEVLMAYLGHLELLHKKAALVGSAVSVDLAALLGLPGVLQTVEDEQTVLNRARPVVVRLAGRACDKLLAMRATEGQLIADDLTKQCRVIDHLLVDVGRRAPKVIEAYHQRLRARIDELLARAQLRIEEKDLIREVAVFAERADISEEITRMSAHMAQFEKIVGLLDGEPAGRTLDFVAQELLREANTIASKSNDAEISRAIVEVKGAIDRIKEQVQNVE